MSLLPTGERSRQKLGLWYSLRFLLLRRLSQFILLCLFTIPIGSFWILQGTLASSIFLQTIPLNDPFIFLQSLTTGHIFTASGMIGAIILTVFYWLMGGRSYCAWVCPINPITDAAHWTRQRLKCKNHVSLSKSSRLWIMGVVLVMSSLFQVMVWELINPITGIFRSIVFMSLSISSLSFSFILLIFVLDTFVANRLWCSHLCPVGAFYKGLGYRSPLKISAPLKHQCDDCADCYKVCPEFHVLRPVLKGTATCVTSTDCTRCGRCIDVCHLKVFQFEWALHTQPHTESAQP